MKPEAQLEIIARNAVDLISREELLARLSEGRPLRVKYGADPSAPDLHLGHMVQIKALRALQELGHRIIFIIGDFTAMLGDPSGRSATRPQLSREEVEQNARTYVRQVGLLLDTSRAQVVFNSEWLGKLTPEQIIRLAAGQTVARMLERDDFANRYQQQAPIGLHEFLYPLFQAYDSVEVNADLELGGTDQLFNFLLARELMRDGGISPQVVITRPLIPGTDGVQKMSKSLGNYIGLTEPPDQIYGKLMSVPDELIEPYLRLLTDLPDQEIARIAAEMASGSLNPRDAKARLAREITGALHGRQAASEAEEGFRRTFAGREQTVDDFQAAARPVALGPDVKSPLWITSALTAVGIAKSGSEARRLVLQGAVWVDGEKMVDPQQEIVLKEGMILRAGKRRVVRVGLGRMKDEG